ncbi:MAG: hypothetical protein H7Y32_17035 [Chloroflexales bacterium]|nr:hypothetical protein [Chloroflexales bacterium]
MANARSPLFDNQLTGSSLGVAADTSLGAPWQRLAPLLQERSAQPGLVVADR